MMFSIKQRVSRNLVTLATLVLGGTFLISILVIRHSYDDFNNNFPTFPVVTAFGRYQQYEQRYNMRSNRCTSKRSRTSLAFGSFFGGVGSKSVNIPKNTNDRDNGAIVSIQAAIKTPRTPSVPLIECEFPLLSSLNKLGDGSLQSSNDVDDANINFCTKLVKSLSPILPNIGPKIYIITSTTSTNRFLQKLKSTIGTNSNIIVQWGKDGIPLTKSRDICVYVAPCISQDYSMAKQIANNGNTVILVNGFAKDTRSVPNDATMAYYVKPITYNSQIAGYLLRSYPGQWTVVTTSNKVLATYTDDTILVSGTNTPDLRQSVKLIQKSFDDQAILARTKK